jgi:hypothetical protein
VTNDNRFSCGFLVAAIQLWLRVLKRCTSRLAYPSYLGCSVSSFAISWFARLASSFFIVLSKDLMKPS